MIAAIIIYFHFTKKSGWFCEIEIELRKKFGFSQRVPIEDTNDKTISSEPSAPPISNKI